MKPQTTVKADDINPWKLNKDNSVGTLDFKQRESIKSYKLYPMISLSTLIKNNIIIYGIATILFIAILALIFLVSSIKQT